MTDTMQTPYTPYTNEEKGIIAKAYHNMLEEIKPHITDPQHLELIDKAYHYTLEHYDGKHLVSGKAYMLHLIEMARMAVTEFGLAYVSVVSAFLHGITYKLDISIEEIEELFGKRIAVVVEGFEKISEVSLDQLSYYSDNFRSMFFALSPDVRSVMLKLIHRLYDVRNQGDIDNNKLNKYFYEIKYLYIPIAHRLGLYKVKDELENAEMRYSNPEIYSEIESKLKASRDTQRQTAEAFLKPIQAALDAEMQKKTSPEFTYTIKWRLKSIPSIYAKMQAQGVPFEQVYDIFAARIVIDCAEADEIECCWLVYSLITNCYEPIPERFRDWITTPKASGYRSLHTTVKFGERSFFEVQIRSTIMDDEAERGQAAHTLYKKAGNSPLVTEQRLLRLRKLIEHPDEVNVESSYSEDYHIDKVFVFTEDGALVQLPAGATILDLAYETSPETAHMCSGAIINGKPVSLRQTLNSGDKVQIVTDKRQTPNADWMFWAVTQKAKDEIKRSLEEERLKDAEFGHDLLMRRLKNWKMPDSDETISLLVEEFNTETPTRLFQQIMTEEIDLADIKRFLESVTDEKGELITRNKRSDNKELAEKLSANNEDVFILNDDKTDTFSYKKANCCMPMRGDSVFGFLTSKGNITIHRTNCPNSKALHERFPYRIVKVNWETNDKPKTSILVHGYDKQGLLGRITKIISDDLKVGIGNVSFTTGRNGLFDGKIALQTTDNEVVKAIVKEIKTIDDILDVEIINY